MIRYDCLKLLAPGITDQLVVTSLSGQKIEWANLSQHPGNLLVGTMGTALGVGIGLAIGLPQRKVIVLESDGSMLLSLFNLPTLANLDPKICRCSFLTIRFTAARGSANRRPLREKPISQ